MTSRFEDSISLKMRNPDEQIRSQFVIYCDCGRCETAAVESKGLAKDRFRALGWRFIGTHLQRWRCPTCERVNDERLGRED